MSDEIVYSGERYYVVQTRYCYIIVNKENDESLLDSSGQTLAFYRQCDAERKLHDHEIIAKQYLDAMKAFQLVYYEEYIPETPKKKKLWGWGWL